MKNKILNTRHFLVSNGAKSENIAYYNAYLLLNFGIKVDKPDLLTRSMVETIANVISLYIPRSFFDNPQDMKYYSCEELFVEQLVSYFFAYYEKDSHIKIFEKEINKYLPGEEIQLREFKIVNEDEATAILTDIFDNYCQYSRPFSISELNEFLYLYDLGLYNNQTIKCKDNIVHLLKRNYTFARFLDKKDLVKLSISLFGEHKNLAERTAYGKETIDLLAKCYPLVKNCALSKKQAKYFNKLVQLCTGKKGDSTNEFSPYAIATKLLAAGNTVEAARIFAENGSLLERNLKMLISRANPIEAVEILSMVKVSNPILLYQLISKIANDNAGARTFTFYHDNKLVSHTETEYETTWRKSRLNESTGSLIKQLCIDNISKYYNKLPKLGKVYVADNFYKIPLVTNTSANGRGLDVLPSGSRVACETSKIRTFVYWDGIYDIDASLILVDNEDNYHTMNYNNYRCKEFGEDCLFSGDVRASEGSEFFDLDLDALRARGIKTIIQTFHGFESNLNTGNIFCGYQNKKDLNTTAWDPKNIAMQFRVIGDTRACMAFAIDVATNEIITLNTMIAEDSNVVKCSEFNTIKHLLNKSILDFNIGKLAECRGELVNIAEEADVVFADNYTATDGQTVIRSFDVEKLAALVNC